MGLHRFIRLHDSLSIRVLSVILITLIVFLSILDAPEFVRCTHIGLCEFLDFNAHIGNIIGSDIIKHILISNFFSLLEDVEDNKKLITELLFFGNPYILSLLQIPYDQTAKQKKYKSNPFDTSFIIENGLHEQALQLIKTTVILS